MNTSIRIWRLLLGGAVAGSLLISTASAQDVLGTWTCSMMVEDPTGQGSVSAEFEMTYKSDGTYERMGLMTIVMAALQIDTSISIAESGDWTKESMVLTEMRHELEFAIADEEPSQMEQMIVQQMQAAAEATSEESMTITSLTATSMSLQPGGGDDGEMMCDKS